MKAPRKRIDVLLHERGLATSREKAKALLMAGAVVVNGQKIDKPGALVDEAAHIEVRESMPYVSRGGFKLARALDYFGIDPAGRICADIGSSTGGFTDCLLQRGALRVHAIDVGAGQLDWKLRQDTRVIVHESLNARYLQLSDIGEPVSLAVCDVSFISVTLILPEIAGILTQEGEMVILVKPQFEVGREQVGKGGIIREPLLHLAACEKVAGAAQSLGFSTRLTESPILGAEGNREFLMHAVKGTV